MPAIDALLGTGELTGIVDAIEGMSDAGCRMPDAPIPLTLHRRSSRHSSPDSRQPTTDNRQPTTDNRRLPTYIYDAETPRVTTTPKHFAYVKIAEGCDYT